MVTIERYAVPASLDEALDILRDGGVTILAGGTDLMVQTRTGARPWEPTLMNIRRLPELRGSSMEGGHIRIGALTTVSEVLESALVHEKLPVLARTADCFASDQIRNSATLGGNICNASPAGDMIVPLMLHDAEVELVSRKDTRQTARRIPLAEFFLGPGRTRREPGELLVSLQVPLPEENFVAGFQKFGMRPALDIALVSVGLGGIRSNGGLENPRVVFGAVAPIPLRGKNTEAALSGRVLEEETIAAVAKVAGEEVRPISDFRASDWYRRSLVNTLTGRLLKDVVAS